MTARCNPVIVPLDLPHCSSVARLHCLYMKSSIYGRLGEAFLTSCYTGMLQTGFGTGFVSLQHGTVNGFAFGPSTPRVSLTRVVRRQWRPLLIAAVSALVRRPVLIFDLLKHFLLGKSPRAGHGTGELLSIVVDPDQRGSTDAVQLAECLFDKFREDGCRRVVWETLRSNHRAQSFYKKVGGREVPGNPENAIWYEKSLGGCKHTWHAKRVYAAFFSHPCPADFVAYYTLTAPSLWEVVDSRQQQLVDLAFAKDTDLEALEYACRLRGHQLLPRLFTLAVFLAEARPEAYPSIINLQKRTLPAFVTLAYFSLRSVWLLLKGTLQLRRLSRCVR